MSAIPGMLDASQGGTFEARVRVRVLASFYLAGATLVLLTLALPHAADANDGRPARGRAERLRDSAD